MAVHAHLKNEFTEDEKSYKLISGLSLALSDREKLISNQGEVLVPILDSLYVLYT